MIKEDNLGDRNKLLNTSQSKSLLLQMELQNRVEDGNLYRIKTKKQGREK